jgi:hypothetical protein
MQAQTLVTRQARSARAVPGKHAKKWCRAYSRRTTTQRILAAALMAGTLAVGSAAAAAYATPAGHASTHHHMVARPASNVAWMY